MRRTTLLIMLTAFFGLAFLVACGDQKEAEKSKTEVTSADVKKEAKEAMETAKTYAQQQKEEYLQQIEAKMKEYDREMQELLAKAQSGATDLKEESKAQFDQSMEELRNKKEAAAKKLNEINSESGEAWKDIKSGMESAMDELSKAFDRARSHFKS
jgi:chromosome segregation ATPase